MRKYNISKVTKISLITIFGIIMIICIAGYLILNFYLNKMNLVEDVEDEVTVVTVTEDNVPEEVEDIILEEATDITDSPQAVIEELEENITQNTKINSKEISSDDVYNILLIGCDSREAGGSGRSDAMIIVSINSKTKKIILTSLLRDIYLKLPSRKNNRLNAAYAYGGAKLLIETIEENFRINIDKYISMDFYTFIDIVDALEGVTLNVKEEYIPIINYYIKEINQHTGEEEGNDLLSKPGNYVLNGKQTLGYVRNRYSGTDFERTARQREVLQTVFGKIKDLNYSKIMKLSDQVLPQITTNLSKNKIISMILSFPTYRNYEIEQWSIPMEDTFSFVTINKMSVIGIDFEKNIRELHNRVYGEQ